MPIRESEKHRYPKNWPEISALARFKAGNRCQDCHLKNGALGGRTPDGDWRDAKPTGDNGIVLFWPAPGEWAECCGGKWMKIIRIVLTVGHLDHNPENNKSRNHRVWCQQCHLRYDAKEKARGVKSRRRAERAIRELFSELPGTIRKQYVIPTITEIEQCRQQKSPKQSSPRVRSTSKRTPLPKRHASTAHK